MGETRVSDGFPTLAGVLFGLGLGGFFDGIVLHQLLQWHHMVSSWRPITSLESLEVNTLSDGIFHGATYLFIVAGLFLLWQSAHRGQLHWSAKLLVGSLLLGWGLFNVAEGLIDHELLGVHHVNETEPRERWIYWDLAFLVWGAAMIALGAWLIKMAARA